VNKTNFLIKKVIFLPVKLPAALALEDTLSLIVS